MVNGTNATVRARAVRGALNCTHWAPMVLAWDEFRNLFDDSASQSTVPVATIRCIPLSKGGAAVAIAVFTPPVKPVNLFAVVYLCACRLSASGPALNSVALAGNICFHARTVREMLRDDPWRHFVTTP